MPYTIYPAQGDLLTVAGAYSTGTPQGTAPLPLSDSQGNVYTEDGSVTGPGTGVDAVVVVNGGTGYSLGDQVYVDLPGSVYSAALLEVYGVSGGGVVTALSVVNTGFGYAAGTYTTTSTNGVISAWSISPVDRGSGHTIGETLTSNYVPEVDFNVTGVDVGGGVTSLSLVHSDGGFYPGAQFYAEDVLIFVVGVTGANRSLTVSLSVVDETLGLYSTIAGATGDNTISGYESAYPGGPPNSVQAVDWNPVSGATASVVSSATGASGEPSVTVTTVVPNCLIVSYVYVDMPGGTPGTDRTGPGTTTVSAQDLLTYDQSYVGYFGCEMVKAPAVGTFTVPFNLTGATGSQWRQVAVAYSTTCVDSTAGPTGSTGSAGQATSSNMVNSTTEEA